MTGQPITNHISLLLILIFGFLGTLSFSAASRLDATASTKVEGGPAVGSNIDNTKLSPPPFLQSSNGRIKRRGPGHLPRPHQVFGISCQKSFYFIHDIKEVTRQACPEIQKVATSNYPSKNVVRLNACKLKTPNCNSNEQLFTFPIVPNRKQKVLGFELKSRDRVVISLNPNNICQYQSIMRKNMRGQWTRCVEGWKRVIM